MFIELHKLYGSSSFTINVNMIQYLTPAASDIGTVISVLNCNDYIAVEESYYKVKELIEECQMK